MQILKDRLSEIVAFFRETAKELALSNLAAHG